MRLAGLLTAPMAWLVVVYLGSLFALFITAFWTVDDFTGQLVKTFTLSNFQQVLTNTAYLSSVARTISIALLVTLFAQANILEYHCRLHWHPNSIAMWDNLAVQHYASSDYWPDIRVMERASIVGVRPSF
mgnify:CR=1 FL=1